MNVPAAPLIRPGQPYAQPQAAPRPPQPMRPTQLAATPPPPRPTIRMQAPDSSPRRLTLPSPEQLGLIHAPAPTATPMTAEAIDWNATRQRLQRWGAISFHVDQVSAGGYRVTFLLPTRQPNYTHCVEATAATESAAVALALDRAEQWVSTQK